MGVVKQQGSKGETEKTNHGEYIYAFCDKAHHNDAHDNWHVFVKGIVNSSAVLEPDPNQFFSL